MKATPDGDGSLLDHSVYLYGSGMGNPSIHDHENLPILVAGGAASGLKGGRHIRYQKPDEPGQSAPDAAGSRWRASGFVHGQHREKSKTFSRVRWR